eukprot:4811868-Pyramimonas_sp.AAC.2
MSNHNAHNIYHRHPLPRHTAVLLAPQSRVSKLHVTAWSTRSQNGFAQWGFLAHPLKGATSGKTHNNSQEKRTTSYT